MAHSTLLLLLSASFSNAIVEFTDSVLYDVYDFDGKGEISIPMCNDNHGCYIYASTEGKNFPNFPNGIDPYAENLEIIDNFNNKHTTVAELSMQYEEGTTKKAPFIVAGNPTIVSILNKNKNDYNPSSIVIYVVKLSALNKDIEIYDAINMNKSMSLPASVTTIMSASPFEVVLDKDEDNSVETYLVGFDNAFDGNQDLCPIAYKTQAGIDSSSLKLQITVPIISFVFEQQSEVQFTVNHEFETEIGYEENGFFSSAGWNGCRKPDREGYQVFRSPNYDPSRIYVILPNKYDFQLHLEAEMNIDSRHSLTIRDVGNAKDYIWYGSYATGTGNQELNIERTMLVEIFFDDALNDAVNEGFIIRHSARAYIDPADRTTAALKTTTSKTTKAPTTELPTTTKVLQSTTVEPVQETEVMTIEARHSTTLVIELSSTVESETSTELAAGSSESWSETVSTRTTSRIVTSTTTVTPTTSSALNSGGSLLIVLYTLVCML